MVQAGVVAAVLTATTWIGAVPSAGQSANHAAASQTRTLGKFGDWVVYTHDAAATRICFVSAQPRASEPRGLNRDAVHLFVSGWPREGVKTEVSVKLGYPARRGSDVTVTIGQQAFKLFTAGDRAFVADATEELKLVEALRKGSSLTVQATSERGTQTRDTYTLQGLGQALQAMVSGCG
jgi:invasion protein IalB